MAVSKNYRRFKVYQSLLIALKRCEITKAGCVSSLLLECFLEDGGRLPASKAVARGVCEEGKFTPWRDEMVKSGWLVWSQAQGDKGQYFAGKKLIPYLNKEKIFSKEIATRDEVTATRDEVTATRDQVEATRDEVAGLRAQLNSHEERFTKIDEAVQELRRAMEPPDSEEKRKAREKIAERLTNLSIIN